MQPLVTRLRSLRRERFDSSTGRRRRGGVAVAAGLALALFVGSGIAVAAVSSASAHTPAINADCTGVHVQAWDYTADGANTVAVTIFGGNPDGTDRVENRVFGASFDEWFMFPDSSIGWSYSATIDAPDGTDGTQWDYSWSDTTTGCEKPDISITASQCVHPGDLTSVDAVLSPLDPAHAYTVRLTGSNGYDSGEASIQTTTYSWSDLEPGYDYTAVLLDTTSGLSDSATVHAVGCPQDPNFEVTITQCTAVGGNGAFDVTVSGLVSGRSYVLALINDAGGTPVEVPFTATGATFSNSFSTSPSGTYRVTITDSADGTSQSSNSATYLPCPDMPVPLLDPTQCTSVDGASDASMISSVDKLIPGRSYLITITSGATTAYSESLAPAASSSWTKTLYNLAAGEYVLTVTDTTDPVSAGFTAHTMTTIRECPSQQEVALEVQQCSVPGGSGSLTSTVTNFTVGRDYTVSLTQNGLPVAGQPVSQDFAPVDASPGIFTYQGLAPGFTYRIVVQDVTVDDAADQATIALGGGLPVAANDIVLKDCPGNPDIVLVQPTCTLFTSSTIAVDLAKLLPTDTYTVSVINAKTGVAVPGVPEQQVAGTDPAASLTFTQLPFGANYIVTVSNANKTLAASKSILLTLCDLPTLAYTGASTVTPTLAGLGFLQFGLVLVGISLVRRRSGAREV